MTAAQTPGPALAPAQRAASARRTDLDALRLLLCVAIMLLHAAVIFSAEPIYHLKSAETSFAATVLSEFLRVTAMPGFFVLAGWSAIASLRGRSPGGFARERVTRLLVPLIAGVMLLGPIVKYIELSHGLDFGFHGFRQVPPLQVDFLQFWPRAIRRLNLLTWANLWFLAYLFLISLLLLPLLVRIAQLAPRTAAPSAWVVYLPAVPMALLLAGFNGWWPYLPNLFTDWTNFSYFALCFAIGAGIAAWPGFETRLMAEAPRLLILMVLGLIGVVWFGETTAGRACVALTAWGAIGGGMGLAARFRPVVTPVFRYFVEAALPLIIIHQVPMLVLGVVLLPLALPLWVKLILIWLGGSLIALAAYHWLIRPWSPVRRLMGMSPLPSRNAIPAASAPRPPA